MLPWAKEFGLQHFVSGVVFWCLQVLVLFLILLVLYLSPWRATAEAFVTIVESLLADASKAPVVTSAIVTVAGVSAVVIVIVTGLFLHLLGLLFTHIEVSNFKRHLEADAEWARGLFEEQGLADKYDEFVSSDGNLGSATVGSRYDRLQRALFAYLDNRGTSTQTLKQAKYAWWLLRSVAVTLVPFAVELVFILAFVLIILFYANPS
jgi:hypothetical protein